MRHKVVARVPEGTLWLFVRALGPQGSAGSDRRPLSPPRLRRHSWVPHWRRSPRPQSAVSDSSTSRWASVLGAPVWVALASAIGPCEVFGAPDIALARCKGFWSVRIHRAYTLRRLIIVAERIDSHNPPDPVTVRRAVIVVVGLAVTEPRERSMEFGELPLRDGLRRELMRLAFHSGAADNERGPYPVPHG